MHNTNIFPDDNGYFGDFGGVFVSETLVGALDDLTKAYTAARNDADFQRVLQQEYATFIGRPTPLQYARRLTAHCGGSRIYLKREDLNHTGAHKINNAVGQALLAERLGKKRIIAETGAGQHGVAAATVAARFGMACVVYMGAKDIARQKPNVERMQLLGAKVVPVTSGAQTLKDALSEAMRDWISNVEDSFYIIGSAAGPHPYPMMVRDFVSVIGREVKEQCLAECGTLPDALIACVGGGSNAIGLFHPFIEEPSVSLVGVEAGGHGVESGPANHAATLHAGRIGVLHGSKSFVLQDENGQVCEGHSISAGLDYPGVGPEHAWLKKTGRAHYVHATDTEALDALRVLARTEGIIAALESSHAVAHTCRMARSGKADDILVVNVSGRGDKDMQAIAAHGIAR